MLRHTDTLDLVSDRRTTKRKPARPSGESHVAPISSSEQDGTGDTASATRDPYARLRLVRKLNTLITPSPSPSSHLLTFCGVRPACRPEAAALPLAAAPSAPSTFAESAAFVRDPLARRGHVQSPRRRSSTRQARRHSPRLASHGAAASGCRRRQSLNAAS